MRKQQLKISKFCISIRGPTLCNKFLTNEAKIITSIALFQEPIRNQLVNHENEFASSNNKQQTTNILYFIFNKYS